MDKKIGQVLKGLFHINTYILLAIVILIISIVFYFNHYKTEGFGDFYTKQDNFTKGQRKAYWDNMNVQLDYNADLENDMVKLFPDAVKNIDTNLSKIKKNNLDLFFRKDPIPGNEKVNLVCSNAKEPLLMPEHGDKIVNGCGWWYIDDSNTPSFGSMGSKFGPYADLNKSHPSGKWIWDLTQAQKMEDIKICKKIKSCEVADLYPGKCGYCHSSGIGVPVDKFGSAKYPDDEKLACANEPIVKPSKCPKPDPPAPIKLADGTIVVPPLPEDICKPTNGKLTLECLKSLAIATGFTDQGAIVHILSGDSKKYYSGNNNDSHKYKKAIEIVLKDGKIPTEAAYLGKGVCEREEALTYFKSMIKMLGTANTKKIKDAIGFLTIGTEFEPCYYKNDEVGPFDTVCLQRVAKDKGCQPDGTDYPTADNTKYDKMTWAKVNSYFDNLHKSLSSSKQSEVDDAAKRCLGITIQKNLSSCGDKSGCEVFWYAWDYEWEFPNLESSMQTFYGRELKSTLPHFNTANGDYNPFTIPNRMSFHLRTNYVGSKTMASKFWVMTDDGIAIKVNDTVVQKSWRDQGATAYETTPFTVSENKPTKLDFYWYQNYGGATFVAKFLYEKGLDAVIPSELELSVPKDFPIARWDFYEGKSSERNNILTSKTSSPELGAIDGRKSAIFNKGQGISIENKIRGGAFSAYTFMTFHRGGWTRLFALRKGTCQNDIWTGYSIEGGINADSSAWFAMQKEGGKVELYLVTPRGTVPLNKWTHLAYVLDADFRGVTIYADAKKIGTLRIEKINGDDYKNTIFNQNTIGHDNWKCNGPISLPSQTNINVPKDGSLNIGLAWTHWFDYTMTAEEVNIDRGLGFTDKRVFAEDSTSGWKKAK